MTGELPEWFRGIDPSDREMSPERFAEVVAMVYWITHKQILPTEVEIAEIFTKKNIDFQPEYIPAHLLPGFPPAA